ncbi:hypothetical protein GCM10023166_02840 [Paeniglutamicibacter cryotolerans]
MRRDGHVAGNGYIHADALSIAVPSRGFNNDVVAAFSVVVTKMNTDPPGDRPARCRASPLIQLQPRRARARNGPRGPAVSTRVPGIRMCGNQARARGYGWSLRT